MSQLHSRPMVVSKVTTSRRLSTDPKGPSFDVPPTWKHSRNRKKHFHGRAQRLCGVSTFAPEVWAKPDQQEAEESARFLKRRADARAFAALPIEEQRVLTEKRQASASKGKATKAEKQAKLEAEQALFREKHERRTIRRPAR